MTKPIIKVENLSKSYVINHEGQERYTSLRDVIANKAKKIFSFPSSLRGAKQSGNSKEEFWALKDLNFEINQGDRVGIIGRNGAGKSTLLKILSRITEPTTGSIKIKGRVASLLEVGTGFHPELTGRENIFLNGAILGMSRVEIRKHFDAIVDFAEVDKFLDTPVKRYSSGMYVRLAFAVAAHLEPEILIVDEVLAVGDAQFQKKCLGKMEDVSKNEGRTVLFVSHQLPMIMNLCSECILLKNGTINEIGETSKTISIYLKNIADKNNIIFNKDSKQAKKALPFYELFNFSLSNQNDQNFSGIIEALNNTKIQLNIEINLIKLDNRLNFGFILKDYIGNIIILSMNTDMPEKSWINYNLGYIKIQTTIDTSILNEGKYYIYFISSIHANKMLHTVEDEICLIFEIVGNRGNSPYWVGQKNAILAPFIKWEKVN